MKINEYVSKIFIKFTKILYNINIIKKRNKFEEFESQKNIDTFVIPMLDLLNSMAEYY